LNVVSLDNDVYTTEDKYNNVAFVLPVLVQRHTPNPHYLHLDSCLAFNQVFTKNHISDLEQVRISLRAGCNTGTSTPDKQGMILGAIKAWLVRSGITNLASLPHLERKGWTFDYKAEEDWLGTSPNDVTIVFYRDISIYDGFPFVDLHDQEIRGAFVQIEAMQHIMVVDHIMVNVADTSNESGDEYLRTGTNSDRFGTVNGMDADGYDTDASQHMGNVLLINTIRMQLEGLTPREVKETSLARIVQSRMGNPTDRKYKHMVSVNSLKKCPVQSEHITNATHAFSP
jgi:hypothetical protein